VHLVSPRVLLFLERDGLWLFLRGAAHKWFAGRVNGLGGHVEPDEDVLAAAYRESEEETGLRPVTLRLVDAVHVASDPPALLLVYVGTLPPGDLRPTAEGEHVWCIAEEVAASALPFADDVPALFARLRRD